MSTPAVVVEGYGVFSKLLVLLHCFLPLNILQPIIGKHISVHFLTG